MKYAQWQVLTDAFLTDIADPEGIKAIIAQDHISRAEFAYGQVTGVEQAFYTRVGRPIDDTHIPTMAMEYSEVGDVVLVTVTCHNPDQDVDQDTTS